MGRNARPPYSAARLMRMASTWVFHSDAEELYVPETDEPKLMRAYRRISKYMKDWRDVHTADDDPWLDESYDSFCVADVALIFAEYARLSRFEERVISALNPPTKELRWNRRRGKFEEW